MRCPKCGQENKDGTKLCVKCGENLSPPLLTWKWHVKTLVIIYIILAILYVLLKILIK